MRGFSGSWLAPGWGAVYALMLRQVLALCLFPLLLNYLRMPGTGQLAKDGLGFELLILSLRPAVLGLRTLSLPSAF